MDDDDGDYLYEKREDTILDRMYDLMSENQRLQAQLRRLREALSYARVRLEEGEDNYLDVRMIDEALQKGE
jgi:hypothetical protein